VTGQGGEISGDARKQQKKKNNKKNPPRKNPTRTSRLRDDVGAQLHGDAAQGGAIGSDFKEDPGAAPMSKDLGDRLVSTKTTKKPTHFNVSREKNLKERQNKTKGKTKNTKKQVRR
jgi:hypothetical protein